MVRSMGVWRTEEREHWTHGGNQEGRKGLLPLVGNAC